MQVNYSIDNHLHTVAIERTANEAKLVLDEVPAYASITAVATPRVTFSFKDKTVTACVIQSGNKRWVHVNGRTLVLTRDEARRHHLHSGGPHQGTGSGIVIAPMPGQVRRVLVAQGDMVAEAQPLFILEAMKMELKVLAPHAGVVTKINVVQGASVEREQILGEIEEQS